jgi:hypothetical protein
MQLYPENLRTQWQVGPTYPSGTPENTNCGSAHTYRSHDPKNQPAHLPPHQPTPQSTNQPTHPNFHIHAYTTTDTSTNPRCPAPVPLTCNENYTCVHDNRHKRQPPEALTCPPDLPPHLSPHPSPEPSPNLTAHGEANTP